jgi:hypothetical protein
MPMRSFAAVIAVICWSALVTQFGLILEATDALKAAGMLKFPAIAAVVVMLSFLTVQINALIGVVTTLAAFGVRRFERSGRVRAALLAYLWAGSAVFILVLQPYWHHTGTQLAVDVLLHNVVPLLYGALWLLAAPKDDLRWRDPFIWLIYPLIYVAVVLTLARWSGFYPYPVIDVRMLSVRIFAGNIVAVTVTFLAIGLAVVAVARSIAARQDSSDAAN